MSGPKCGEATIVDTVIAEALRLRREREERIRRAKSSQQRDEKESKSLQRSMSNAKATLQKAQTALESMRVAGAEQMAAGEAQHCEKATVAAQAAFNQVQAALDQAQRQFQTATAVWRADRERYKSGHFSGISFADAQRQAENCVKQAKQVIELARTRQEQARLQREMERQHAEAESAALQARMARAQLDNLPRELFTANEWRNADHVLDDVTQAIQKKDYSRATQLAQHAAQQCELTLTEAQAAYERWQEAQALAHAAVEQAQQMVSSVDEGFVNQWAPSMLAPIQAQLHKAADGLQKAVEVSRNLSAYTHVIEACEKIQRDAEEVQQTANHNYGQELQRLEVVNAVLEVLEDMDFNTGAQLADVSNPLGEVLIAAAHPSGQEISMRVDIGRKINLNLEDGLKGADCVADVHQIIAGLQKAGIDLHMTDWGTADPDRIKIAQATFGQGTGNAQQSSSG